MKWFIVLNFCFTSSHCKRFIFTIVKCHGKTCQLQSLWGRPLLMKTFIIFKTISSIGKFLAWPHIPEIRTVGLKIQRLALMPDVLVWTAVEPLFQYFPHMFQVNTPWRRKCSIWWLTDCQNSFQLIGTTGTKRDTGLSKTADLLELQKCQNLIFNSFGRVLVHSELVCKTEWQVFPYCFEFRSTGIFRGNTLKSLSSAAKSAPL